MRKIRLLAIGHSYILSANRAILERLQEDHGFEVTVAAPNRFEGDLRDLTFEEDKLAGIPLPAYLTGKIHFFFYRGLHRLNPADYDLVYLWEEPYIFAGYQIAKWCKEQGLPFVFKTDQNLVKKYPWPFSYFENFCHHHAAAWIGCGRAVMKAMQDKGFPPKRGHYIPYSVDEKTFRPHAEKKTELLSRLALKPPIIGYMGRLTEEKGLWDLLAALDHVDSHFNLLILGSGPLQPELEKALATKGHQAKILLVKHEEVPEYLRTVDILVAPSRSLPNWTEQFGRMLIEAFASKVCVVGSDSGEIPYVIDDCGLIFPEGNRQALADALTDLLENPEKRQLLAKAGYERCHEKFSATKVGTQYASLFQSLI